MQAPLGALALAVLFPVTTLAQAALRFLKSLEREAILVNQYFWHSLRLGPFGAL